MQDILCETPKGVMMHRLRTTAVHIVAENQWSIPLHSPTEGHAFLSEELTTHCSTVRIEP